MSTFKQTSDVQTSLQNLCTKTMMTPWNIITILLLFLLLFLNGVEMCVRGEEEGGGCVGGRPPSPNGCCPVRAGERCGGGGGGGVEVGECDVELGYRCVDGAGNVTTKNGVCTGRHNLTVTDTGTSTVTLQWNDFKPANYYFEYVLLFRKNSYIADTAAWKQWDIGTREQYRVAKLEAGSLYCMRLAVWVDARATVLGNLSEAIWVTTDAATQCTHNGRVFELGEVVDNCEDRCTCTATGRMHCTPSCPQSSLPEVPEGCSLVFLEECSCNATVSCPPEEGQATPSSAESCQHRGDNYADGLRWTDMINCTSCTCEAGHVVCEVTCEQPEVPEGCVNPRRQTELHGCCPVIVCGSTRESAEGEEEGCSHNGTVYRVGASFASDCALCVCSQGNHVNCTSTVCPPLERPLASLLCPSPHVQRDGCCDTLFCMEENPDPQVLLSRLMALSFGPDTLTISFDVDHVTSGHTVTQDRYEVMTSDGQGGAASWSSRTYTPTTLNADDNVSSPSDLLHADAAIRVDDRVFITLDGLRPNTSYYVRVEPVVKRDMGVTDSGFNSTLVGFFVARTMAIDTTCLAGDILYQNGDVVSDDCEAVCTCVRGEVVCRRRTCPEEHDNIMVPSPSVSCPRPQLIVSSDVHSCCKTWRCFPQDDGCIYKNTILKNDETVLDGECSRKCMCTKGEVTCTPVCPPVSPAPRSECILTNVSNSCCPVWMCPQVTKPPVGLTLASRIGFHGDCPKNATFKTSLSRALENRIKGHMPCADRESPFFVRCWVKDVVVTCPRLDVYRKRRQTTQMELVAVIAANNTDSNSESKIKTSLNKTENALAALFTTTRVLLLLDSGRNVTSSGSYHSFGISHLCSRGFVYQQNVCELEDPSSSLPPQLQNMTLTPIHVTSHSATLLWHPPFPSHLSQLPFLTACVIEFRMTSSSAWNRTMTLNPMTTTNYTLVGLSASERYEARLVALTVSASASSDRVVVSDVHFTTAAANEAFTSALTLDALQVTLGDTFVTFKWPPLPAEVTKVMSTFKVTYRQSTDQGGGKVFDLDPSSSEATLSGLERGKTYVSKFVVCLLNGTTVTMASLHFVTKTSDASTLPVIPLLATCAVLVLLSVLIPVIFLVWRRMHRKTAQTAFENKTYGVNM
ncbi:hypothetical protein ACOMHN_034304 [Nucella lapillus]